MLMFLICGLFNDDFKNGRAVSRMVGSVNDELEKDTECCFVIG